MTTSNYITFILLGVIGLVFLIDFILNSRKKPLEKSVEKFVQKEKTEGKSSFKWLNWIVDRKKNITLSILIVSFLKFFTHYYFFRLCTYFRKTGRTPRGWNPGKTDSQLTEKEFIYDEKMYQAILNKLGESNFYIKCENALDIFNVLYFEKLQLFIPVTIVFLIVVWFFNDKIKAR